MIGQSDDVMDIIDTDGKVSNHFKDSTAKDQHLHHRYN